MRKALAGTGLVVVASLALVACTNKLTGELDVKGEKFVPESCRSGQALGFSGVELSAKDGRRVRIAQTAAGDGMAIFFAANETKGIELGKCGAFSIEKQSSRINDIYNVKGSATMECDAEGVSIKGSITFENCH